MMAIAHDPKVTELQTMFQTFLVPSRTYDLKVQKTIINRLKKPFPSNCTDDKHWDIFEGRFPVISFIRVSMEKINENGKICHYQVPIISFVRLVYKGLYGIFVFSLISSYKLL